LSLNKPIRNPNKLKVKHVRINKNSINKGYCICNSTKKLAVKRIITPTIRDLDALAPTKPIMISSDEIGAANTSYTEPVNLGKKIPNAEFDILWVRSVSIRSPGTINEP
jgi:hypothetical protein